MLNFEKSKFSSAEADAATGVSAVQQRNLRRSDYLPEEPPYEPLALARLLILGKLDELHLPPSFSSQVAATVVKSGAVILLCHAQQNVGAVFDPQKLAERELPIKFPPELPRFLIVDAVNHSFEEDLSALTVEDNSRSVSLIIDLRALGAELVRRAGRPLWRVVPE